MKRLVAILNREVQPFGMLFNALGHMMVGMAPRFPQNQLPNIDLYLAPSALVRQFRARGYDLHQNRGDHQVVFSDFAHTTTQGSAFDHQQQTRAQRESDINYFASAFCGDDAYVQSTLADILQRSECQRLNIDPTFSQGHPDFEFTPPIDYPEDPDFVQDTQGFTIALSKQLSTANAFASMMQACILAGSQADRNALRLHQYPDASGTLHYGMSEYGLVALKGKKAGDANKLRETVQTTSDLNLGLVNLPNSQDAGAVAMFGSKDILRPLTSKGFSVWSTDLDQNDIAPPSTGPDTANTLSMMFDENRAQKLGIRPQKTGEESVEKLTTDLEKRLAAFRMK